MSKSGRCRPLRIHRLDESQLAIPRRVALQQSSLPLRQLILIVQPRLPFAKCNSANGVPTQPSCLTHGVRSIGDNQGAAGIAFGAQQARYEIGGQRARNFRLKRLGGR